MVRDREPLTVGIVVNPIAGIGGPAGMKGSDGVAVQKQAVERGGLPRSALRMSGALRHLSDVGDSVRVICGPGSMGMDSCEQAGIAATALDMSIGAETIADDTRTATQQLLALGIDVLLFSGGDGTARDVLDVIPEDFPVLGVPAGVKMHSGVFAISPVAAGELLVRIVRGQVVSVTEGEVRDIDEASFRSGQVKTRFYGVMTVPDDLRYVQQVKTGGREDDSLVAIEIAASLSETIELDVIYLLGSGSTLLAIKHALGFEGTLLGVDVFRNGEVLALDASEQTLLSFQSKPCAIVVSFIAGQGHVFGRGNQQFSAQVIKAVGPQHIQIVGSKRKLATLDQRPLLVDTGDLLLDQKLAGLRRVTTGYEDAVLYRVSDRIEGHLGSE
ncbi:MAG: ATP-NAD kinase [Gammaproteobacteria bacterium]|nr:ATP-NAD kinase [Gammaproteobacteria bacterium]RPG24935.1 MAG: ATP-NAD kinase [Gammaproteobacteria bacterium TMED50]